uniref:Uncharacterized protein n=2 Tax=Guillardia theta TaxID=55529 RepID=A0A7S4JAQ6_GUITH|mmetsp:Transcript_1443/g.4361  ORF Transcript_1443/g.4361 Transcript_1443/m.4361 type:complete len:463 (+) Transcript_1443:120-1508(+)
MTHSSRHRCLLLLTESPVDASNRMRIFSDDSLQEIWSMQLMPGHMWSLIASSKLQTDIPSALDPEAAAIDSEIFLTVSYVETNDPKSSASSYLQDKEEDKQREDDSQEFQRGEKAVIAAWEIESVISKPREDQDPDVTFDIRLIGIKEVKKVFTYLHSTDQFGVFFASAASELFLVKCSSLDESRDAASFDKEMQATGRRFGRIGELHMKLKVDILPGEPDHKIPYVGKGLVHDGSYKDGSACALRWLGDMDLIEIHSNNLPPSPGSELFEVVASLHPDREGLHEIVSCKLFDKSRGVVGDALGNLLIFERLGDRIAALFCMNARSGGITRIMEGRMGLHFLNKVDESHPPFIFVTTDGAIGSVSPLPADLSEKASKLHAALQTLLPPFTGAWHKNVFPRRNAEVASIGDFAGRETGLVDGDFLQLLLRCVDDEVWKSVRGRMKKNDEQVKIIIARVNNLMM